MPYADPPVAGSTLVRPAIKSPNYVAGVSGWSINRDGSAEFNNVTVRGSLVVVNGNASIVIKSDAGPAAGPGIAFNPDSTVFTKGVIWSYIDGSDANRAHLQAVSPVAITTGVAAYTDWGSSTGATPYTEIAHIADIVRSTGYLFDGAATSAFLTSNSAAVVPGGNLDVVTLNMTSSLNASIFEIKGQWHGLGFVTPVAFPGNVVTMRLTRDGTQIASCRILGQNTALTQMGGNLCIVDTPAAGNHTYALSILHEASSTAASVHTVATGNSPTTLTVQGFGD